MGLSNRNWSGLSYRGQQRLVRLRVSVDACGSWRPLGVALIGYPEAGPTLEGLVVLLPLAKQAGRSRGV